MAEEPQPSTVTEGADAPDVLPASKEDRKAAAAMSSLDVKSEEEPAAPKKEVDSKALAEAMKYLSVGQDSSASAAKKATEKKVEAPKQPLVKVDAADVALLVEQLDMGKVRATELLRAQGADVEKTMRVWVEGAVIA